MPPVMEANIHDSEASVVTSKPANGGHLKTGQRASPRTRICFTLPLLFRQGHFRKSLESSPLCGFPIFLLVLELTEIRQLEFVFGFIFLSSLRIRAAAGAVEMWKSGAFVF